MKKSACISSAIPLLAMLSVDNGPAIAKSPEHGGGVQKETITPGTIMLCPSAPVESSYYMVTLHVPDATALLTSSPCTVFPHGCVEGNNLPLSASNAATPTLLDVNLNKLAWQNVKTTSNVELLLHIVLEDSNMSFMPPVGATLYAVQQDTNDTMFDCETKPQKDSDDRYYVDVLVKEPPINKPPPPPGSLNIGIEVDESNGQHTAILPIILDPHVPNNGAI